MTDIRRTLLWVVFSMSLVLIWDAWNKHNGQPSLFGPSPAATSAPAAPPAASGVPTTVANATPVTPATASGTLPVPAAPSATAAAETVTITTDLVKATLDSRGGDLVRLELLKQEEHVQKKWYESFLALFGAAGPAPARKNIVLLDRSAQRYYAAQSGLIPPSGGSGLPNHHTPMAVVPGERSLKDGANELQVRFESPEVGGVKLAKTYTFRRGDYVVGVRHEIVNTTAAPVSPRLYLQLVRDGNPPAGESSLYFTFTGPAIYTDATKFQKIDFKSIEKRKPEDKADHALTGDSGWVAMVQHYFATGVARSGRRRQRAARVLHRQVRHRQRGDRRQRTRLLGRHVRVRSARSRAERPRPSTRACSPARRKRTSSPRSRRGSSWSRTTAGSRSSPSRCSGC